MSDKHTRKERLIRGQRGHSLVETAIMIPVLMTIAFNAINIGYFWYVGMKLSSAPRVGVEYASQGGAALASVSAPTTAAVSSLVYENLTNSLGSSGTNASVRVCSSAKGVNSSTHVALCDTFGPSYSFPAVSADPESNVFILHRVDVAYTVTPIISGAAFGVVLPSNMTFHRQVSMRSLY